MNELENIKGTPEMGMAYAMFKIHSETRQQIALVARQKNLEEESLLENFVKAVRTGTKSDSIDINGLVFTAACKVRTLAETEGYDFEGLWDMFTEVFQMELDDFVPESHVTGEEGKIPTLEEMLG